MPGGAKVAKRVTWCLDMAFFLSSSPSLNVVLSAKDKTQGEFMTNRPSSVNHFSSFFFGPVFK